MCNHRPLHSAFLMRSVKKRRIDTFKSLLCELSILERLVDYEPSMSMRLSIPNLSAKKPKWGLLVKLLSAREEDVPSVYKGRPGMIQEMSPSFLFYN